MATLTETAVVARKIVRYSIYGVILIVIARYTYLLGMRVYQSMFPPPPPPPTVKYDKLAPIQFPSQPAYEGLTFILETPDLSLPELVPQANVYFMPKPSSNIQSVEQGKIKADKLKFNPEGRELSDTVYLFERSDKSPSTLTMNVVTNTFSISYDLSADPDITLGNPPVPQKAVDSVKNYLSRAGLLPTDISDGVADYEFIKLEDGQFVGTISLSEADMIKVNLFRKDYEELAAKTPDPKEANIWFIVTTTRKTTKILAGEYHYFAIDEASSSTYPIRTAKDAWDDLNTGKAYIADMGKNPDDADIKIRRVYLAYYDPGGFQEYYQPIIVFEGDNEFVAYVPAIAKEYYGVTEEPSPTDTTE
jgi:hypothetical protein